MMRNPFNPSFGKMPSIFLNRDSLVQRITTELNEENSPFQTSLLFGQRGSGKTTLMTSVSQKLQVNSDWIVIDLVLDDDLLISLLNQLNEHLMNLKAVKNVNLKLNFLGAEISTSLNQQVDSNFQVLFENSLTKLTQKGIKVLILIDEVHDTHLLRKLVSCYQIMIRKELQVSLLMASLPENVSEVQNDEVLTFLLRANRIVLDPLDTESIKNSYKHIFENAGYQISLKTILLMTKQTRGFAYAFQLLGYLVWEEIQKVKSHHIKISTIKKIHDRYISDLFRNVYFKIYKGMSEREREFVQAMVKSKNAKVKSQTIGKIMKKQANYVAVYRRKLIDDQVIISAGYGYVSFLLPYFDKFVEQQMILDEF